MTAMVESFAPDVSPAPAALRFLCGEEDSVLEDAAHLLRFDNGFRHLLPRGQSTAADASTLSLSGTTAQETTIDDLAEEDASAADWDFCGQKLHAFTLEFEDKSLEARFLRDLARRSKRWVSHMLTAASVLQTLYSLNMMIAHGDCLVSAISTALYIMQYLQLSFDRAFVLNNFQEVLFLGALMQVSITLTLSDRLLGQYESIAALAIFVTFIVYRLRFLYFTLFCLYTLAGSFIGSGLQEISRLLFLACAGLLFLSYSIERMQRKDFVQASTAWSECQRTDLLLQNILPLSIIKQLKHDGGRCGIAQSYDQATVLFADVVSFTTMSSQITPSTLVALLNRMFQGLDAIAEKNGVEKIKTIGDCYMAASGLPVVNPLHAQAMARFGLQMLEFISAGTLRNPATGQMIQVRIGIHSGPCVAGVIGHQKFFYDVWGDAVNTASRMESHGEAMKLHCSSDTFGLIKQDFICEARPAMYVKGKGEMQTYFVQGERQDNQQKCFVSEALKDL